MKRNVLFCLLILSLWGCLDSIEPQEEFAICDNSSADYFSPTNKTFILPSKSNFLKELRVPLELEDTTFYNLTASKVCLLEQHLGQMTDSLNFELCAPNLTKDSLDNYYYRYFGLRMGEQDYILVNAFHETEVDSFDWKQEAFIGECRSGLKQWRVLFNLEELTFSQYRPHLIREIHYLPSFPYISLTCTRCLSIKNLETFQLIPPDICLLENHLHKLKEEKSEGCYSRGNLIDFNKEWLLQYMGVKKEDRRWIYINASCLFLNESEEIREEEIENFYSVFASVCDGGACFWGVLFDLDSHEFEDLQFNSSR